jgi:hypothetical protein
MVSGAGEKPAKSSLTSPDVHFLMALPCGESPPTVPTHTHKQGLLSPAGAGRVSLWGIEPHPRLQTRVCQ